MCDDQGRVSELVTVHDPMWLDEDVAAALAWQAEDALRCGGCGFPRDLTFDEAAYQRFLAEPLVCHACGSRDRGQRAWSDAKGDPDGLYWQILDRELMTRG